MSDFRVRKCLLFDLSKSGSQQLLEAVTLDAMPFMAQAFGYLAQCFGYRRDVRTIAAGESLSLAGERFECVQFLAKLGNKVSGKT
ncbi:hypothetical protein IPC1122_00075 [Pseudomonas aeruginosa]|nr:hypothetical protein AO984_20500 [Pseudomonas aeruginosa]RPQ04617.1 hypothetical protein IPC1124_04880 [Pseudomonas aeruginosa]RPQ11450.1 hypothetical protein IPC1112_10540 [Pseudomonas aeruginosa]RPQ26367.1 hypothetical protein IPC1122_00075 [Pseudomonas aeruginosa]RPX77339.1 hypothetical protein IPC705_09145 [Pseudomonas aeruginosa]